MKGCSFCQSSGYFILTVLQELSAPFLGLHFQFCISGCTCGVFQFQDITVVYIRIALLVGQEEEVAITVVHFQFRLHQVVGSKCKIGFEEALQVSFTFHGIAHGRIFAIGTGNGFKERLPMAIVSKIIYQIFQMRKINSMTLLVIITKKTKILLAHAIIRDTHL